LKHKLYFNDTWAYRDSVVRYVDPRIKLVTATAGILFLFGAGIYGSLAILTTVFAGVILLGYPIRFFMARLGLPLVIAIFFMLTKAIMVGQTPLVSWSLGGIKASIFIEGVHEGLVLALRIISGVSLITIFSIVTSMAEFISAASWFHVPAVLLETLVLCYRYIFILLLEAARLHNAQQLRLGHDTWRHSFVNTIKLGALVLVRALDKAEISAQAMQLRGYEDSFPLDTFERRRK